MKVFAKVNKIRRKAYQNGASAITKKYERIILTMEKKHESHVKGMEAVHRKEIRLLQRKVENQLRKLQQRELVLENAINDWNGRIEQADSLVFNAQQSLQEKQMEKMELFQKLARHIAEESLELKELVSDVYNHKVSTIRKTPFLYDLKKSS